MRTKLAWIVGLSLAANGVLAAPAAWHAPVPGVPATGAFNAHFVRDIGAAYLVAGMAAFLALHALVHLRDAAAGREAASLRRAVGLRAVGARDL
jgi:hypothetical protein